MSIIKLKFLSYEVLYPLCVSSVTKNLCILHIATHNHISTSSTVGIQLHVLALYFGNLQVVI